MVGVFHRLRSTQPTGDFANSVYALEFVGRDSYLDIGGIEFGNSTYKTYPINP